MRSPRPGEEAPGGIDIAVGLCHGGLKVRSKASRDCPAGIVASASCLRQAAATIACQRDTRGAKTLQGDGLMTLSHGCS
jgi:hypothetical protein